MNSYLITNRFKGYSRKYEVGSKENCYSVKKQAHYPERGGHLDNWVGKIKTPCYIIDTVKFEKNINYITKSFSRFLHGRKPIMGYSVKTNHNIALMKCACDLGMYAEVVSDDEYEYSLDCGFSKDKIILNGPQKSERVLLDALKGGAVVNLDNHCEIDTIEQRAAFLDTSNMHIGIRVNFDLEKYCPDETTSGKSVSRFGFCLENGEFARAVRRLQDMNIPIRGLHMHYSTKTRSVEVFRNLALCAAHTIKSYGLEDSIEFVDIGGGFFMGEDPITEGKPTMSEYAEAICAELGEFLESKDTTLLLEPGASAIATSVQYVSSVINLRDICQTRIVTVDGSLLHINPFMAHRRPVKKVVYVNDQKNIVPHQIVCGASCMESDRLFEIFDEQELNIGDYIICRCAGAYTMGFNNSFINVPPYVYICDGNQFVCVRERDYSTMKII